MKILTPDEVRAERARLLSVRRGLLELLEEADDALARLRRSCLHENEERGRDLGEDWFHCHDCGRYG